MLQKLKIILKNLGLNATDIRVFIASFQLGGASASAIAKQAGLNRITTYETLKRLAARSLVKTRVKQGGGVRHFEVEDIDVIKDLLTEKQRVIHNSLSEVKKITSAFHDLYIGRSEKPTVLFYEGKVGIKNVILDTLKQKPSIILSFSTPEVLRAGFSLPFLESYWKKRTSFKIPSRGIALGTQEMKAFFSSEKNKKELRRVKFISSENFIFKNEIDIYGDNVSIISLKGGNEHGVILRSRDIAQGLRSIFEFVWSILPEEK